MPTILSVSGRRVWSWFFEPWTFSKGLCGRNLPDITSDLRLGFPSQTYTTGCPFLDCISSVTQLKETIQLALEQFYLNYQQDLPQDGTETAFQSMVANDSLDFGRPDELTQKKSSER